MELNSHRASWGGPMRMRSFESAPRGGAARFPSTGLRRGLRPVVTEAAPGSDEDSGCSAGNRREVSNPRQVVCDAGGRAEDFRSVTGPKTPKGRNGIVDDPHDAVAPIREGLYRRRPGK